MVRQGDLVAGVAEQMQLVAEPLEDLDAAASLSVYSLRPPSGCISPRPARERPLRALRCVESPLVWRPRSGTASPRRRTIASNTPASIARQGSPPSRARNRLMFQGLGTSATDSMPPSLRRSALRLSSSSVSCIVGWRSSGWSSAQNHIVLTG